MQKRSGDRSWRDTLVRGAGHARARMRARGRLVREALGEEAGEQRFGKRHEPLQGSARRGTKACAASDALSGQAGRDRARAATRRCSRSIRGRAGASRSARRFHRSQAWSSGTRGIRDGRYRFRRNPCHESRGCGAFHSSKRDRRGGGTRREGARATRATLSRNKAAARSLGSHSDPGRRRPGDGVHDARGRVGHTPATSCTNRRRRARGGGGDL